jgi:hypothetical protein
MGELGKTAVDWQEQMAVWIRPALAGSDTSFNPRMVERGSAEWAHAVGFRLPFPQLHQ